MRHETHQGLAGGAVVRCATLIPPYRLLISIYNTVMIHWVIGLIVMLCAASAWAGEGDTVRAVVAFEHLRFHRPLFLTHWGPRPGDESEGLPGSERLVVVEQGGRVYAFENNPAVEEADLVLDIRRLVRRQSNEEGLLGFAFHPQCQTNGRVYLHYTAAKGPRRNVLAEFQLNNTRDAILSGSWRVILEVEQPWSNHNGGMIAFGPDGYLYIALGDGGAAADPRDHAQDLSTLLGTILRIDVDRPSKSAAYSVPADNPFAGRSGARGEIWAYGLRNAWRFSFDRQTGDLWAGDVGQDKWEEIDLIKKGGNYGWNEWEGLAPFKPRGRAGPFEQPVVVHGRGEARSITGGYVYRGQQIPHLQGMYIYGDFETGLIWGLRYDGQRVTEHRYLTRVPGITSFGEDRQGELYIVSFKGRIYKIVPLPTDSD